MMWQASRVSGRTTVIWGSIALMVALMYLSRTMTIVSQPGLQAKGAPPTNPAVGRAANEAVWTVPEVSLVRSTASPSSAPSILLKGGTPCTASVQWDVPIGCVTQCALDAHGAQV